MVHNQRTFQKLIILLTFVSLLAVFSSARRVYGIKCSYDEIYSLISRKQVTVCEIKNIQTSHRGRISIPKGSAEYEKLQKTEELEVASEEDFEDLPTNLFEAFPNLLVIDVRFTGLKTVSKDDLRELSKLMFLRLSFDKINSIQEGAFDDLVELEKLFLEMNQIRNLDKNLFDTLKNLKELDLSHNYLSGLDSDIFKSLTQLTRIDLSYNKFDSLHDNQFQSNNLLKKILLAGNKLRYLSANIFVEKPNLEMVLLLSNFCINKNYQSDSLSELINDLKSCSARIFQTNDDNASRANVH